MAKKETRYGPNSYYRKQIKHPRTGEYQAVYGKTIAEREEKVAQLRDQWARELELAASPYFYQYAAGWFELQAGSYSTARKAEVAREINKNICPVIGEKKLSELTSDDVRAVMATRADRSRAAQTKTLQILRRILADAAAAGKISRNPAEGIRPGGRPPEKREALSPAQQDRLLAAVRGLGVEIFVLLGLYAGLRREEICGLMWRDVHLDGPAPHIDVRQACRWVKNNKPEISETLKSPAARRTVPVPPPLLAPLASRGAEAQKTAGEAASGRTVVCTAAGQPWTYTSFRAAWGAIEARTEHTVTRRTPDGKTVEQRLRLGDAVPKHPSVVISLDFPVTPHVLRHTYITRLILGGVDVRRVQYLAGHETAAVTLDIYTSLMGHRPEDLIDDVSAVFPG